MHDFVSRKRKRRFRDCDCFKNAQNRHLRFRLSMILDMNAPLRCSMKQQILKNDLGIDFAPVYRICHKSYETNKKSASGMKSAVVIEIIY